MYVLLFGTPHLYYIELPGILGLPNQVWSRANMWNDFYLLNNHKNTEVIYDTGEIDYSMVVLNVMNGKEVENYPSWGSVTTDYLMYYFHQNEVLSTTDETTDEAIVTLTTGASPGITGGIAYIGTTVQAYIDVQKPVFMHHLDRTYGAVFITKMNDFSGYRYRGVPEVSLTFKTPSTNGTFVVYMLGVDHWGWGHLFTFTPWTYKNMIVNDVVTMTMPLTLTVYDMPKDYRLGVVIATHDYPLYMDQNVADSKIEIISGSVKVPLNKP